MTDDNDMALTALLKSAHEVDPAFSQELLRSSFNIQRRHQFDADALRGMSTQELMSLLEAVLDEADPK